MMKKQLGKHQMDGLLVLVLFSVFAGCVLSVLLTGAGAYRRLAERDDGAYDRRTAAQYLATKVRQADTAGGVALGAFDGAGAEEGDTLFLRESIDGEWYVTRVYCRDGYLRELFSQEGEELAPEDGQQVLQARALRLFWSGSGQITAELTDAGGRTVPLLLTLRSGEAVS